MERIIIFLGLFFFSIHMIGQDSNAITIAGIVFDKKSKKPLPYANISLLNNKIGTISNKNGEFKILLPSKYENDSLNISYLNYKSVTQKILEISKNTHFFLVQDEQRLEEVIVTNLTAEGILKKAILKISKNYYDNPYKSKGFYRLSSKKEKNYIHLSEAVFEVYRSRKKAENQLKLTKARAIKDTSASHGIDLGLKTKTLFAYDVINNVDALKFLDKEGFEDYEFLLEAISMYNGKQIFVISFDQKKKLRKAGYKGVLHIDAETYAFIYLDFGYSPIGLPHHKFGSASLRRRFKRLGRYIKLKKNNYKISYKNIGNKYYLSKVKYNAILSFKSSREHYDFNAHVKIDYLVTVIKTENIQPFDKKHTLRSRKLIEQLNTPYDPFFWDHHNILLPDDFNFGDAAKTIEKKNRDYHVNRVYHKLKNN